MEAVFFSVLSAKWQVILFLVVYLFSTQTNGKAPIKTILPEAPRMPLYQIFNDPFACLLELSGGGKLRTSNMSRRYAVWQNF